MAHSLVFAQLDPAGTRTAEIARRAGISRQAVPQTVHELQRLGRDQVQALRQALEADWGPAMGGSPGGALPPQLSTATVMATSRAAVSSAIHAQVTSSISRPSP